MADDFEALVHSQDDFSKEIETLRMQSQGVPIKLETPSQEHIDGATAGDLGERLREKLDRAFPNESAEKRLTRAASLIRSLLIRDNTMDTLRIEHPVLWEKSRQCLDAEEQRLSAIGTSESRPSEQLAESMERIETSLRQDLQGNFPTGTITQFSTGTVADWLVRCPLDFPQKEKP